ncbi:MAG TPA: DNA methyltransferase [Thermoplasmata archaeon]|nr:DNA methyltransferase [Thermoplasmata archaeon]
MTRFLLELSGENPALAEAEAIAASEALGGRADPGRAEVTIPWIGIDLPEQGRAIDLAKRVALTRRVLVLWEGPDPERALAQWAKEAGSGPTSASFRAVALVGSAPLPGDLDRWVDAWSAAGGTIDLDRPSHRIHFGRWSDGSPWIAQAVEGTDRGAFRSRRMPSLPFQRPVALPPKLARVAVNLARVRLGDRVLDPFLGTGALLAEAGLLGASLVGIDRDPEMVRGALRNFRHLGVEGERLLVGDAGQLAERESSPPFDALVTDPPYGRASALFGERAEALVARVVSAWAPRVREGGRVVLVVPGGPDPLPPPWVRRLSLADRVHRSLTREFRVYERAP